MPNSPQASQMDNDAINLAKAIRQTESGGDFNAKGGSGESGAYQWTPDTWKAHAGTVLGNPSAEMSPSNQNAVAYKMIKTWKDQGMNPAQIAAKWNSGSEVGWENKRGVNSYGVQYDVPKYVKSVTDAYQKVKAGSQVGIDPNNPSSIAGMTTAQPQGPVQPQEGGGIGGFLKSMVSAPATMLARPFQAGAELLGASAESVNKWSDKLSGGLVAPVPQNMGDVKKDIGRGIQTAAFGMGPVSGGAAFGAGYSLEEGNDLMSVQTAFSTVLGAGAGKVLDLVGKPLLNGAGKVVGVITPQVLKNVAGKGAQAITQFMAQHEILPKAVSTGINKGAEMAERVANAPFKAGGNIVKAPFVQNDAKVVTAREKALQDLEEKYSQLRANVARDPKGTAASRSRVARSNVLTEDGMINEDGVIIGAIRASEAYEADAIGQGNKVVRQLLDREGVALDLNTVQREMERVMRQTFDGAELTKALKQVQREIDGLRIKRPNGRITLSELHDNKISSRPKGKDYDDPAKARLKKAVSRTYKETIEKNSKENVREINAELQKFYDDAEYIANLQGKRIDSGKLGKAVARVGGALSGAVIGGALGGLPGVAAGSYVGGVVSSKLAGRSLQKAFGKPTKLVTPKSKVIGEAVAKANAPRNQLALPAPSGKTPIPLRPPKDTSGITVTKALKGEPARDPKTGRFFRTYLSGPKMASETVDEKTALIFASPNVKEDLNFEQAKRALTSTEHRGMVTQYRRILDREGLSAKVDDAIGDWADGAENTTVTLIKNPKSYEQIRATSAEMGLVSEKKAVIPFMRDRAGKDTVYEAVIVGKSENEIRKTLDELGFQFRTLVTKGDSTKVIVFDSGSELAQNINKLGNIYGIKIKAVRGKGEFLGGNTREEGAEAYRNAIREYRGRDGGGRVESNDNRNVNAKTNLPNLNGGEVKGANPKGGTSELPEVRKSVKPVAKKGAGEVGKKKDSTQYKQFGSQLRKQIKRDLLSDKIKAVVIDSDTIKKKHPDFDPDKPNVLHEESSALSKELFKEAIDQDSTGIFRMTGGGAGSGKSEAVLKRIKSQPSVIFDGVLANPTSAIEKIDYALSKGKRVEVYPVYAPIELATTFNRMRKRRVPSDEFVKGHFGFRETIPQLINKYGKKIKVKPYQNAGFGVKPQKLSQKQWEAKEIVNARKMSLNEIKKKNDYINELIDEKGVDWTKEHINDILKKIYGEA